MTKKIIQVNAIPVTSISSPFASSASTIVNTMAPVQQVINRVSHQKSKTINKTKKNVKKASPKKTNSPPVQKKQRTPRFIEYDPCSTGRRKLEVPPRDIEKCLSLTQAAAAAKLNISISTLKRRFYSISQSRWPRKSQFQTTVASKDPDELEAIVHDPQIQSFVNNHTTIGRVSSVQQLLNRQEMDTKWMDPITLLELHQAFSQHVPAQFSSHL